MNEPLAPEQTLQPTVPLSDSEREFDELLHAMAQLTQQMDERQSRIEQLRAETQALLSTMTPS